MTDWIVEPLIARRALALAAGAHALEVALSLAASVTRGYGLPGPDGWARDFSMQGKVLACGVAPERLGDTNVDMDRARVLELRDPEGHARPFAVGDVQALVAELEEWRAALVVLADVEPDALDELARVAEALDVALLAIGTAEAEIIPHSVLHVVELRPETYAVVHVASRIGPLASPIGFSTWAGPSWDGLVDPAALEALAAADVSPADAATALEGGSVPFVPFVTTPQAAHGGDFEHTDPELEHLPAVSDREGAAAPRASDPESAFLLEQLAKGALPARVIQRRGAEHGFSVRTLRKRAEALGIERRKTAMRGGWLWVPPARATGA